MTAEALEKLKFPIGEFIKPEHISEGHIQQWIEEIASFPAHIIRLTENLSTEQINWKYRPGGWKIKQVVHHCADSHMNSIIRFKLALTEDSPTIRPYYEGRWAELIDSQEDNLSHSISLLSGLHHRWVALLKNLTPSELKRAFVHPEHGQRFTLEENIGIYAWHCNHHQAHIEQAIASKGKYT